MARYIITEKAGMFVAGHRNTGVGTSLELPPHAAEYEIILGTLVAAEADDSAEASAPAAPADGGEEAEAADKGKRKKR